MEYVVSVLKNILSNRTVIQIFTLQKKIWKSNYCRIKLVGYSILIIILSHLITPICLFSKVLFLCLCKTMFFFMHHLFFEKSLNGSPKLILIVQWFLNPGTDHT